MDSEEIDTELEAQRIVEINKDLNKLNTKAAEHWKKEDYPQCLNYIERILLRGVG